MDSNILLLLELIINIFNTFEVIMQNQFSYG